MKKIISTLVCLFIVSPTESLSKEYRFDIEHHIDGDKYNVFNADITPPGNYMVDYYVNSEFVGAGEIYFRYIDNKLTPCVTKESLLAQGVIKGEVDEM
ncbi:TPA: FimD/PapC N-terminal domain-containing protein, partial [Salmonella enterica subsp. enterica serovar Chester]